MNRRITFLLGVTLVITTVLSARDSWTIRESGIGPAKIGMNLSELNRALNEKFVKSQAEHEQDCYYLTPTGHDVGFMILHDKLARVDVDNLGVFTSAGIQVGDTEKRALTAYGSRLKVSPHHYDAPEGHYLTAETSDGKFGIRFETWDGKITRFYAGSSEAIALVEGCQ